MRFFFSYKDKSDKWVKPEPCASAQEGRDKAYERRGHRRGGWATASKENVEDLRKFIMRENAKNK